MHTCQNGLQSRRVQLRGGALCTLLLGLSALVEAAPQSPFVFSDVGVWDGRGTTVIPEVGVSSSVGPVLVEIGALPVAYGKYRSAFGSNGFEMQVAAGQDREVDGGSIWSDGFILTGGAGSGSLNLSVRIDGSVTGQGEMFYGLFVSDSPFDLQTMLDTVHVSQSGFWAVQFPNASRVFYTGVANRCGMSNASKECGHAPFDNYQGALDITLTGSTPFTFGQAVYVASVFGGGVGKFGGTESFFNSASFGITVPPGSALQSISGTPYTAAVPEPSAWVLLAMGVLSLLATGRKR